MINKSVTCCSLSFVGLSHTVYFLCVQRKTLQYLSERYSLAPACAGPFHPVFRLRKCAHHPTVRRTKCVIRSPCTLVSFLFPASASQLSNFILPRFYPGTPGKVDRASSIRTYGSDASLLSKRGSTPFSLTGDCSTGHIHSLGAILIKVSAKLALHKNYLQNSGFFVVCNYCAD
jgi:hypothetical protein